MTHVIFQVFRSHTITWFEKQTKQLVVIHLKIVNNKALKLNMAHQMHSVRFDVNDVWLKGILDDINTPFCLFFCFGRGDIFQQTSFKLKIKPISNAKLSFGYKDLGMQSTSHMNYFCCTFMAFTFSFQSLACNYYIIQQCTFCVLQKKKLHDIGQLMTEFLFWG